MPYTSPAQIRGNDLQTDGSTILRVVFTGDAGEPERVLPITITSTSTALQVRQWVGEQITQLNSKRNISTMPALQVGQPIAAAAITPVVPTAEQIWLEKARRLIRLKAIEMTNATAVQDVATLQADVDATYLRPYAALV